MKTGDLFQAKKVWPFLIFIVCIFSIPLFERMPSETERGKRARDIIFSKIRLGSTREEVQLKLGIPHSKGRITADGQYQFQEGDDSTWVNSGKSAAYIKNLWPFSGNEPSDHESIRSSVTEDWCYEYFYSRQYAQCSEMEIYFNKDGIVIGWSYQ